MNNNNTLPDNVQVQEALKLLEDKNFQKLLDFFPAIPIKDYPLLNGFTWEACHQDFMGAGGLFLVSELGQQMALEPGMKILDLCSGKCASSIFLAKHFDVTVFAVDLNADLDENYRRIKDAGAASKVKPFKMDALDLKFSKEHFDAVFCMNSYFYFGTDDDYLPYLLQFLKPGGKLGITSPCYADELTADTPMEYLFDAPDFIESFAVHSPDWWQEHFLKKGLVDLITCDEHPKGREFWLDDVRWLLESSRSAPISTGLKEMLRQQIVMLLTDRERFVTYLMMIAQKRLST